MKWILMLTLSINLSFAADFIKGEGRFVSKDGDGHEFIKDQLIYEGFADIIGKELLSLGLKKDLFWQKYNEQLEKNYEVIETQLKAQMKLSENPSTKELKEFTDSLRVRKLKFKEKFGKLQSAISRFAVKKISRSSNYPNNRNIRLEGTVNSKVLNKIYYQFVANSKKSEYGSLFLNIEYNLIGTTYTELGVENENDFSDVVSKKWVEWLNKNKPRNIANVSTLTSSQISKLQDFQNMSSEQMLLNTPEIFVNSLLLDIQIKVIREKLDKRKNEYTFKYLGSAFLKDLQSNLIVDTYEFDEQEKKYLVTPDIYLGNIIVNHVYGMAIGSFPEIVNSVKGIANVTAVDRVVIENYPNMNIVLAIKDLLENRGIRYALSAQIESISKKKAELIVHYDGQKSDIRALLLGLKAAKKDLNYVLIEDKAVLGIKFNELADKKVI